MTRHICKAEIFFMLLLTMETLKNLKEKRNEIDQGSVLEMVRLSWITWMVPIQSHELLRAEEEGRRMGQKMQCEKDLAQCCWL